MRDRIVCGINHEHIQKRLFAEPTLTFQKAVDIALAEEAAEKQTYDVRTTNNTGAVHAVRRTPQPVKIEKECYRCLRKSHRPEDCKFKQSICHYCGKKGHIQPACRQKTNKNPSKEKNREKYYKPEPTRFNEHGKIYNKNNRKAYNSNFVQEDVQQIDKEYELYSVNETSYSTYRVVISINGKTRIFKLTREPVYHYLVRGKPMSWT